VRTDEQTPAVGPHATVRETVQRYPGIDAVFERHGLGGCGGPDGPLEEIAFFARVHHVDPASLLRELNEFAARRDGSVAAPIVERRPSQVTQVYFIAVAVSLAIAIFGGFPLGILAALGGGRDIGLGLKWPAIVQGHGHLQLVGFAGIFIAGVAYHVLPRFKNTQLRLSWLAVPSIILLASGSVLRAVAQPWADVDAVGALLVISGILELCGAVAFAAIASTTVLSAQRKNYDRYLLVAAGWFVAASLANVLLLADAAADGLRLVPASRNGPLLEMYLLGFITLFILGVSIRILPHFLSLRPPRVGYLMPALVLFNAGLLVHVGSGWLDAYSTWTRPEWLQFATVAVMALAVALFAVSLNLHRRSVRHENEAPGRYELLIRTAYVWLMAAVAIEVWNAGRALGSDFTPDFLQGGAARHALALGFITQMIFGVGSRALPTFAGKRLYSERLVLVSWVALNVATLMRVGHALVPAGSVGFRFDHVAAAGVIALAALVVFAYNLYRTVRPRRSRVPRKEAPMQKPALPALFEVSPSSVVSDVLANVPGSLELLIDYGFKPLADPELRARVTPHVTLATACSMHGVDIDALLVDLRSLQSGAAATTPQQRIMNALRGVTDPELPVNIVDLGLVQTVDADDGRASVRLTPTAPDCPAAGDLVSRVEEKIRALGFADVDVRITQEAAWDSSRMTPAAKQALGYQ
jgi:metal-sulfur cluster biosynthetic enzyme